MANRVLAPVVRSQKLWRVVFGDQHIAEAVKRFLSKHLVVRAELSNGAFASLVLKHTSTCEVAGDLDGAVAVISDLLAVDLERDRARPLLRFAQPASPKSAVPPANPVSASAR